MRVPIRRTLILMLIFAVAGLVLGAIAPIQATHPSTSPYVSALSDLAVKPAYAIACNTLCDHSQGQWFCIPDPEVRELACSPSSDRKHCNNLDHLCPP